MMDNIVYQTYRISLLNNKHDVVSLMLKRSLLCNKVSHIQLINRMKTSNIQHFSRVSVCLSLKNVLVVSVFIRACGFNMLLLCRSCSWRRSKKCAVSAS